MKQKINLLLCSGMLEMLPARCWWWWGLEASFCPLTCWLCWALTGRNVMSSHQFFVVVANFLSLYIKYYISGVSASAIPYLLLEEWDNEGEPGEMWISTFVACLFLGERESVHKAEQNPRSRLIPCWEKDDASLTYYKEWTSDHLFTDLLSLVWCIQYIQCGLLLPNSFLFCTVMF